MELRAKSRRALYTDTVYWYMHTHHLDYQATVSDPTFQRLWQQRAGPDRGDRMEALEELGILQKDEEGGWKYSNAFLSWLFD